MKKGNKKQEVWKNEVDHVFKPEIWKHYFSAGFFFGGGGGGVGESYV